MRRSRAEMEIYKSRQPIDVQGYGIRWDLMNNRVCLNILDLCNLARQVAGERRTSSSQCCTAKNVVFVNWYVSKSQKLDSMRAVLTKSDMLRTMRDTLMMAGWLPSDAMEKAKEISLLVYQGIAEHYRAGLFIRGA